MYTIELKPSIDDNWGSDSPAVVEFIDDNWGSDSPAVVEFIDDNRGSDTPAVVEFNAKIPRQDP